ncbi:motility associated factor glycosyltransferase family protein, partial [Campylobacter sp. W0014]|uniref:motility associated factor glycosyltransferase family protein n=1 Tax=Campylobacter sp. W0014 TaxID=2735781 RepID=UPI001EB16F5C|nr:motility associated factor glycosyltransferase family protein [Campylobacter sp. W0014]
ICTSGNDPLDALQGIEQLIYNLPVMLTHAPYQNLLKQRENLSDTAIIVSTGPSLTKQLDTLKQYANKATIIAADSSYPILAKHNIKPDYVLSLERVPETSEFFNNDFKEFDQDILFITTHLTHPQTIRNLKSNNRNFMLAHRGVGFVEYLKFIYFIGLMGGHSVAHLAYGLAMRLKHKNIIFIGQDLAYAKDGSSHPNDHVFGSFDDLDKDKIIYDMQTMAYGGKNKVYTNETWNLFRYTLEKDIDRFKQFNFST